MYNLCHLQGLDTVAPNAAAHLVAAAGASRHLEDEDHSWSKRTIISFVHVLSSAS